MRNDFRLNSHDLERAFEGLTNHNLCTEGSEACREHVTWFPPMP